MHPGTNVPLLRVVRGEPTTEELAALVVVVAGKSTAGPPSVRPPVRRSAWADPQRRLRRLHQPGAGAWLASALPR